MPKICVCIYIYVYIYIYICCRIFACSYTSLRNIVAIFGWACSLQHKVFGVFLLWAPILQVSMVAQAWAHYFVTQTWAQTNIDKTRMLHGKKRWIKPQRTTNPTSVPYELAPLQERLILAERDLLLESQGSCVHIHEHRVLACFWCGHNIPSDSALVLSWATRPRQINAHGRESSQTICLTCRMSNSTCIA